jgi:hypothetical protein
MEYLVGEPVESTARYPLATMIQHGSGPGYHFIGGSPGKSKQQDGARLHPSLNQPSDSIDQGTSFATTGTRNY